MASVVISCFPRLGDQPSFVYPMDSVGSGGARWRGVPAASDLPRQPGGRDCARGPPQRAGQDGILGAGAAAKVTPEKNACCSICMRHLSRKQALPGTPQSGPGSRRPGTRRPQPRGAAAPGARPGRPCPVRRMPLAEASLAGQGRVWLPMTPHHDPTSLQTDPVGGVRDGPLGRGRAGARRRARGDTSPARGGIRRAGRWEGARRRGDARCARRGARRRLDRRKATATGAAGGGRCTASAKAGLVAAGPVGGADAAGGGSTGARRRSSTLAPSRTSRTARQRGHEGQAGEQAANVRRARVILASMRHVVGAGSSARSSGEATLIAVLCSPAAARLRPLRAPGHGPVGPSARAEPGPDTRSPARARASAPGWSRTRTGRHQVLRALGLELRASRSPKGTTERARPGRRPAAPPPSGRARSAETRQTASRHSPFRRESRPRGGRP